MSLDEKNISQEPERSINFFGKKIPVHVSVSYGPRFPEYVSKTKVFGLPLFQIGYDSRALIAIGTHARGLLAMGVKAKGFIALGAMTMGVISVGALSMGVLSVGALTLGLIAAGAIAAGLAAVGALALGFVAIGAVAFGLFSAGALSFGYYVALGGHARATMIALGDTFARGGIYQHTGSLAPEEYSTVLQIIDSVVPFPFEFIGELFKKLV